MNTTLTRKIVTALLCGGILAAAAPAARLPGHPVPEMNRLRLAIVADHFILATGGELDGP